MNCYDKPEIEIIIFELSDAFTENSNSFTDGQGPVEEDPFAS